MQDKIVVLVGAIGEIGSALTCKLALTCTLVLTVRDADLATLAAIVQDFHWL